MFWEILEGIIGIIVSIIDTSLPKNSQLSHIQELEVNIVSVDRLDSEDLS